MLQERKALIFLLLLITVFYRIEKVSPFNRFYREGNGVSERETSIGNKSDVESKISSSGDMLTQEDLMDVNPDKTESSTKIFDQLPSEKSQESDTKILRRERKPVKLTTKQGLIMNQVLGTYALTNVRGELCRNHVSEFKKGLRAFEPWALKMFDSSSKLMSGILNGNLAEFGAFKSCLNIYEDTVYGPIRGRHCSLEITPTDELMEIILSYRNISKKRYKLLKNHVLDGVKLIWSVCQPDSCTYEDILEHFRKNILETTEGLNLSVSLKKENCITLDDLPKISNGDYIFIFCVGLVVVISVVCTLIDINSKDKPHTIVASFSLRSNARILFATSESRDEIKCLHGIRVISMCYIVTGHRYIHNMATPVVNAMDLVDWVESYFSTIIHGGTVSVDTFFLVSATLLAYNFCKSIENGTKFNLISFYMYRYTRIAMPLILTVATYCTIMKHFGSGPLYSDFNTAFQKPCQVFWWSAILAIQQFIHPKVQCIAQTWYLSVDMIWYYISPAILLPLMRKPVFGYVIFILFYTFSVSINFYIAWIFRFDGGMPVTPRLLQSDYFAYHYTQPLCRGSPYILGLAFGHALFKTKDQKVTIALFIKTVGWILVSFCFPSVILINHLFHEEGYEYNRIFSSLFLSCHRSVWTFCLMWIIWCCHKGQAGLIDSLLSHPMFKVLGRLAYNIYLFHFVFQAAMQNSKKSSGYFSNFLSIYMSLADIILMIFLAIPLTLIFEYPFVRMFASWIRSSGISNKSIAPVEKSHNKI